jgi:uncharacterized protein YqjF (DUF2071 family)
VPTAGYVQVNFRMYVRQKVSRGCNRPGVMFLQQLVGSRIAGEFARRLYREPCTALPMGRNFSVPSSSPGHQTRYSYNWLRDGREESLSAETDQPPQVSAAGSLEEFLTARHWGYHALPGGRVRNYRLTRDPWQISTATSWAITCDYSSLLSPSLAQAATQEPVSVLMSRGSAAKLHLPRTIPS